MTATPRPALTPITMSAEMEEIDRDSLDIYPERYPLAMRDTLRRTYAELDATRARLAEVTAEHAMCVRALRRVVAMAADLTLALDQNTPGIDSFPLLKPHIGVGAEAMAVLRRPLSAAVPEQTEGRP